MPDWIALNTPQAIDALLHAYGHFHDACLTELHYISGAYVAPETLGMQPCADKRSLSMTFHRQFRDPFCIEMRFDGLEQLSLRPFDPLYTSELHQARLRLHNGKLEWFSEFIEDETRQYSSPSVTWLRAESGWWRPIS